MHITTMTQNAGIKHRQRDESTINRASKDEGIAEANIDSEKAEKRPHLWVSFR